MATPDPSAVLLVEKLPVPSSIALGVNTVALILFYAFKSQRKFPSSILAWICILNIVMAAVGIVMATPQYGNQWTYYNIFGKPPGPYCDAYLFFDDAYMNLSVAINTIIAFMLFETVVRNKDLDYSVNKKYFWSFLIAFLFYGVVFPMIYALLPHQQKVCSIKKDLVFIRIAPSFFCVIVQIIFLIPPVLKIRSVVDQARSIQGKKSDVRLLILCVRFFSIYIVQLIALIMISSCILYAYIHGVWLIRLVLMRHLSKMIASILDGVIVIVSNRELIKFIKRKMGKDVSASSGGSMRSNATNNLSQNSTATGTATGTAVEMVGV